MMSAKQLIGILGILLPSLLISGTAFGWAGTTHSLICKRNFDLPVVSQFLGGVDQSAIENYVGEPEGHPGQWTGIKERCYVTGLPYNGFSYGSLGETALLQALMHHAGDVSVPAHHAPACYVFPDHGSTYEGIAEGAAALGYTSVGELPNVVNTTSYTHTQNGHSFNFTGTIHDVLETFEDACMDNAQYYKDHGIAGVASANWNALKIDLMLQRAVMVDYFLGKQNPVIPYHNYWVEPNGTVYFNFHDAYDPDCVTWNSNGTYSQLYGDTAGGGGISFFLYDFQNDGVWDYGCPTEATAIPAELLINYFGYQTGWNTYQHGVVDDEGREHSRTSKIYIFPSGAPEPASLSLLAVGGLLVLRRRSR
ncbi:MAG: PEP-CTERM sorting domain-containing protein [Phycisphaerae bacterium]|nr:PEP-CTERM sorting domain-containing protein [Phycisphaerae bacterium]